MRTRSKTSFEEPGEVGVPHTPSKRRRSESVHNGAPSSHVTGSVAEDQQACESESLDEARVVIPNSPVKSPAKRHGRATLRTAQDTRLAVNISAENEGLREAQSSNPENKAVDVAVVSNHSPKRVKFSGHGAQARGAEVNSPATPTQSRVKLLQTPQQLRFSPLQEVLDSRSRRRLSRSHLSEGANGSDADTRNSLQELRGVERYQQLAAEIGFKLTAVEGKLHEAVLNAELHSQLRIDSRWEGPSQKEDSAAIMLRKEEVARLRAELNKVYAYLDVQSPSSDDFNSDSDSPEEEEMVNIGRSRNSKEETLVLIEPSDIGVSHSRCLGLPQCIPAEKAGSYTISDFDCFFRTSTTYAPPAHVPDPVQETERHKFEKAISDLTKEAAEAKAKLQTFSIELQALGFPADINPDPEDVIASIRNAFQQAKLEVKELSADGTAYEIGNDQFLRMMTVHIRNAVEKIRELTADLDRSRSFEDILRAQLDGLLNKLADVDARKLMLESQWKNLDREGDRKTKELFQLTIELEDLEAASQEKSAELAKRDAKIAATAATLKEKETEINRLTKVIQSYRDEVLGLEKLRQANEDDFKGQVEFLESDYALKTQVLQQELEIVRADLEIFRNISTERASTVSELTESLVRANEHTQNLCVTLDETIAALDTERVHLEEALALNNAHVQNATRLESNIAEQFTTINEMGPEIANLKISFAAEKQHRQAAETDLKDGEVELQHLREALDQSRTGSKELHQKLVELQQHVEKESQASLKREGELGVAIVKENEAVLEARRAISKTQEDSAQVAQALQARVQNQEKVIDCLKVELGGRKESVEALCAELQSERAAHELVIRGQISTESALRADISVYEATIKELRDRSALASEARALEMSDRDSREAKLYAQAHTASAEVSHLTALRASLEGRVSSEATELLAVQQRHNAAVLVLRQEIAEERARAAALESRVADVAALGDERVEREKDFLHALKLDLSFALDRIEGRTALIASSVPAVGAPPAAQFRPSLDGANDENVDVGAPPAGSVYQVMEVAEHTRTLDIDSGIGADDEGSE